jgi:hypothetical protein
MQLVEDSVPTRAESADGWVPINTSLRPGPDGYLAPVATDASNSVEFSSGGSATLARVGTSSGEWVEINSPFAVLPTPRVDGPTATYVDVLPGVDVQLSATVEGMSEVLVIKTANAAANPVLQSLEFKLSGATVSAQSGGGAIVTASDGSQVESTAPTWWDSTDGSDASGPAGMVSPDPVPQAVDGSTVTLNAQAAVESRSVQYPVYIDPDFPGTRAAYTYVDQAYPTQSYWDGQYATGEQRMGYITAAYSSDGRNHLSRALWRMNMGGVDGKDIIKAVFNVTENGSFNCTASQVNLYTSNSFTTTTTWNSQPSGLILQSHANAAWGYSSACPTRAVGFTATTGVSTAADANASTITFELRANSETSVSGYKKFEQSANLVVTYNTPPDFASNASLVSPARTCNDPSAPAYVSGDVPISLGVTLRDVDPGATFSSEFILFPATAGSASSPATLISGAREVDVPAPPLQASANVVDTIPANSLTAGLTYAAVPIGTDGIDSTGGLAKQGWCWFTVLHGAPSLPTLPVTVPDPKPVKVGDTTTVTVTIAPSEFVTRVAYWWSDSAVVSPSPSVPVTAGTVAYGAPLPACGSVVGTVTFLCPAAGASALSITTTPIDDNSTLWVASYDAAADVSNSSPDGTGASEAAGLNYTVSGDGNVGYLNGHGYLVRHGDTWSTSIADQNSATGTDLGDTSDLALGAGVLTVASPATGGSDSNTLGFDGLIQLSRTTSGTQHAVTTEATPVSGFNLDTQLGQILPDPGTAPTIRTPLYACSLTAGGSTVSNSSICAGISGASTAGTLLGYAGSTTADVPAGIPSTQLFGCVNSTTATDYFVSTDASCESQTLVSSLGYIAETTPTESAHQDVDSTKSFTVSAYAMPSASVVAGRTYTAVAQTGPVSGAFSLGLDASGLWRFCMRDVSGASTCATAPAGTAAVGTWQQVTGIYDASAGQIRLLIGATLTPVAIAQLPISDYSSTGPLLVGSDEINGQSAWQWNGAIDDVSVVPGVIDATQLAHLHSVSSTL